MPTLALLGDSILDNQAYAKPALDTASHLRNSLGSDWNVELLAQDGATISDTRFQLSSVPARTDFAVLSAGGNDAVEHLGLLTQAARSAAEVLEALHEIGPFREHYESLLEGLRPKVDRLVVCTIYEPPRSDRTAARLATVPLAVLNDRIIRAAARLGADILDLRSVCTATSDFVLEIEPSPSGAAKIAQAIHRAMVAAHGQASVRLFAT